MTKRVSNWLPNTFGPLDLQVDGADVDVPRRSTINIVGGTVEDDADNERTNITLPSGGVDNGRVVVTFADADVDLTGAPYNLTRDTIAGAIIKIAGTNTVERDLIVPLPANEAESYVLFLEKWMTAGNVRISTGSGWTWGVANPASTGPLIAGIVTPQGVTFHDYPQGGSTGAFQTRGSTGYGDATTNLRFNASHGTASYFGTRGSVHTVVNEQTGDLTGGVTVCSYTMADESLCAFDAIVVCARKTNVTEGGRYKRSFVYRRTGGGAPTIVGAVESGTDQETTAGDDVTVSVSGNAILVRFTAADTDPRNVMGEMRVQEQLAT